MKTIYSLVTKPINQNVAIIRISGPEAFSIVEKIIPKFNKNKNTVEFHKIFNKGRFVDDALVLTFVSPNSFTGEDTVEIQPHGSIFIIETILSMLNSHGAIQSKEGEFMKQAYMNGKIDLTQSEAINTLIVSENRELTELSSRNLNGSQTKFINELLNRLGEIVSNIQVSIDYPENTDLPKYDVQEIKKEIEVFAKKFHSIINDSKKLIKYSKGIVVSIVGFPNAGKSTLLNSLAKEDKAIVSNTEGTTRDIVESTMYIDGIKVTFQDTAGIRKNTRDKIEKEGIKRTHDSMKKADVILKVIDGSKSIAEQEKFFKEIDKDFSKKIINVFSKSDIKKHTSKKISISARYNDIDKLVDSLKKFIRENIYDSNNNNALLITQNQVDNFTSILEKLENSLLLISKNETSDIFAFELETAMKELGAIIGEKIDQNYMTNLFASFCIGK